MNSSLLICAASLAIILLAPWLSSHGVNFSAVGNVFVRLVLVASVLAAVYSGPLEGLLALLAVVTLLIERNHQILSGLPNQRPYITNMTEHIYQPPFETPQTENVAYEAKPEDNLNLKDNNPRLEEGPNNHDAVGFFKRNGLV